MSTQTEFFVESLEGAQAENASLNTKLYNGRTAPLSLDIIIVGCGLGGLAAAHCLGKAGHKVRVLEQAPAIGEVGAGIQVTPNVSRLLIRWGLGDALKRIAVRPEAIVFRRYSTGDKVGYTKWGHTMERDYNSPYYHIHRADFHRMLFDLAKPYMDLHLSTTLKSVSISPSTKKPILHLADGRTMTCDLLIGADGVKSLIRTYVVGRQDSPRPTGDAAYRATIPAHLLLADPELKPFVENPEMTGWMGPGRHIMGYCIRAKQEYNLVMLHPDASNGSGVESWTAEGSAERMRKDFEDFEPRIRKLLSFIPTTLKWKLMDRAPLENWIDQSSNRVVLLGDSCHPMLPYRAQGAAMAIEDAAVIGNLFSHISSLDQIPALLQGYFNLRYERTSQTQASSRLNQHIFHLPDGPEQESRDRSMREAMVAALAEEKGEKNVYVSKGNANQWADKEKNMEQFLYDADAAADIWWRDNALSVGGLVMETARL